MQWDRIEQRHSRGVTVCEDRLNAVPFTECEQRIELWSHPACTPIPTPSCLRCVRGGGGWRWVASMDPVGTVVKAIVIRVRPPTDTRPPFEDSHPDPRSVECPRCRQPSHTRPDHNRRRYGPFGKGSPADGGLDRVPDTVDGSMGGGGWMLGWWWPRGRSCKRWRGWACRCHGAVFPPELTE